MKTRIKVEYGYYHGTLNAPEDGYLYDGHEESILEFDDPKGAYEYLTSKSNWDSPYCDYDGEGRFSVGGTYMTSHGQHSRPVYTVVGAKSGRPSKWIVEALDKIESEKEEEAEA